jgi:hypothetical protein
MIREILLATKGKHTSTTDLIEISPNHTHARNTNKEPIHRSIIACAGRNAKDTLVGRRALVPVGKGYMSLKSNRD